ncbi:cyanoexosortase B system-associated protein [Oscillatoriales cyanobacterium USR001]|nr:cyanoexosortase B system-associated protein [Oscillatoriales cyanobacterium USR001]
MHHFFKPHQLSRIAVLLFLLILVTVGAIPSYLTGKWVWMKPLPIPTLKELKAIRHEGLKIPGWESRFRKNITIGGNKWFIQELKNVNVTAILFLLTQNGPKDQPQVEWTDINGFHRWKTDSHRTLNFTVKLNQITPEKPQEILIDAKFFRSWTKEGTFAVLEWYAWPTGGSATPSIWFWTDRKAQLFNRRVPWVAVCIIIPIKPKDDLEKIQPLAIILGQIVQGELMKKALVF